MEWLEIIGVAVGVLYLYWEYRAERWLWLAGIVMPAVYIFVYFDSGFYADAAINVYYLGAGLWGWIYWLRGRNEQGEELRISHTPRRLWPRLIGVSLGLWAVLWAVLEFATDSTVAAGDAFTTALSVVGLWMLARKYVEQWWVWAVVDAVCMGLYLSKGLAPTGVLYGVYAVVSVFGWRSWRKKAVDLRGR